MKNIFILILCVLFTQTTIGQTVGKIKAETYQAEFEKKKSIDDRKIIHELVIVRKIQTNENC